MITERLSRYYLRKLVATRRGRAHLYNFAAEVEDGDEGEIFEQLADAVTDRRMAKLVRRHAADEEGHAGLFREALRRTGESPPPIPDSLQFIRRINAMTGLFERGVQDATDIVEVAAVLRAIEQRAVDRYPLIGALLREVGDDFGADAFATVARDEARHVRYCDALGRHHAENDVAWRRQVRRYRRIERRAFYQHAPTDVRYAIEQGLVRLGPVARIVLTFSASPVVASTPECAISRISAG